jgi:release factor glutamine methyltransferase
MTSIYEPQEDSALLEGFVRAFARGKTLDLGTGSGVQAIASLENNDVTKVIALDVNPLAVAHVAKRIEALPEAMRGKISVLQSDMFAAVQKEKFDTIICNAPYLPADGTDGDIALAGGEHGYEWSIRFLREAKVHLAQHGQILFLFSSLTNQERIDLELKALKYHHEELGVLASFFERLFVYRIWRS